jgi:hypothetical protein
MSDTLNDTLLIRGEMVILRAGRDKQLVLTLR